MRMCDGDGRALSISDLLLLTVMMVDLWESVRP